MNQHLIPASILACGLVIAAWVFGNYAKVIGNDHGSITVKGLAEKSIKADTAEWNFSIYSHGDNFNTALQNLRTLQPQIDQFLQHHKLPTAAISTSQADVSQHYDEIENSAGNTVRVANGYDAVQRYTVRSSDLPKITTLYQAALDLKASGLTIDYEQPAYLVSNLEAVKMSLIGAATQNAQQRAQAFAKNGNATLGAMRSASQGAFYILAPTADADSGDYGGTYDKSTIDKNARVVVSIVYNLK